MQSSRLARKPLLRLRKRYSDRRAPIVETFMPNPFSAGCRRRTAKWYASDPIAASFAAVVRAQRACGDDRESRSDHRHKAMLLPLHVLAGNKPERRSPRTRADKGATTLRDQNPRKCLRFAVQHDYGFLGPIRHVEILTRCGYGLSRLPPFFH